MSNPYNAPTISDYNDSPPSNDGANTSANEVTWDKHKDKLADPIKNYADAINSAITSAFGKRFLNSVSAESSDVTLTASDEGKLFSCSLTMTITLLAAASAGDGYTFAVKNSGTGTVTIDPDQSETINGASTLDVAEGDFVIVTTDGSEWYAGMMFEPGNVNITGGNITGITDLAVSDGGTGASNATSARSNLGMDAVHTRASRLSTNQTNISSGGTTVIYNTRDTSVSTRTDLNESTGLWTCPVTGTYMIVAGVEWAGFTASTKVCELAVQHQSGTYTIAYVSEPAGTTSARTQSIMAMEKFTSGDTMSIVAIHDDVSNRTINASDSKTYLNIYKITED